MANKAFSVVISFRPEDRQICFYSCVGSDKDSLKYEVKNYKAHSFDEEFFAEFARCLGEFASANPSYAGKSAFVTVLLPDYLISTTSFNIPGVSKKNTQDLFKVATEGLYSNFDELKLNNFWVKQNKQFATIAVALIRKKLIQDIYTACSGANMFASKLSFESSGAACGVLSLNNKLKNETFLLLDTHERESRVVYVTRGLALGSLTLPFGYSILRQDKPVAENMLFSHEVAELAVLNAKEKAKAKQLTMMEGGSDQATAQGAEGSQDQLETPENQDGLMADQGSAGGARIVQAQAIKTLPKKTPRILPKWMQRPVPETHEGAVYENFRIFVKYVLEFVRNNNRLTSIAMPETVFVNMPDEFDFLYDMVNEEEQENKIKFVSLGIRKEKPALTEHLELYGGFAIDRFGSLNNF